MKTSVLLLFTVCVMASGALGAGAYESFAKGSLGIDLTTIPFGTAETNEGFGKTDAPLSGAGLPKIEGLSWMTNAVSDKYNRDFGNRFLKYGFRDGKLAAVRVSISAFGGPGFVGGNGGWDSVEQRRKAMVQIQDGYFSMKKAGKTATNTSRYDIRYGAMCAPTAESLFVMEFQITLHKDKEPANSGLNIRP